MLVLLLLLCFCGGAAIGWRKAIQRFELRVNPNPNPNPIPNPNPNPNPNQAIQRFELRVVPTMRAPPTPKSAGFSPQRLEYVEELDGGSLEQESP